MQNLFLSNSILDLTDRWKIAIASVFRNYKTFKKKKNISQRELNFCMMIIKMFEFILKKCIWSTY